VQSGAARAARIVESLRLDSRSRPHLYYLNEPTASRYETHRKVKFTPASRQGRDRAAARSAASSFTSAARHLGHRQPSAVRNSIAGKSQHQQPAPFWLSPGPQLNPEPQRGQVLSRMISSIQSPGISNLMNDEMTYLSSERGISPQCRWVQKVGKNNASPATGLIFRFWRWKLVSPPSATEFK
jgi:hypothetical protein